MRPKFWQTQKFKELERHWYERLHKEGFKDAEKALNGTLVLVQRAANSYRGISEVQRESKLRYYELLSSGFQSEQFDDMVEALVMERRSIGTKIKEICIELKLLNERCHRETVRNIIRRYEIKWGIRKIVTR